MSSIDADKLKAEFDLIADKYGIGEKKYISIKDIKMIIDKTSTARRARRKTTKRPQGVWQETNVLWETNCGGGMGYDYGYYFKCSACGKQGVDKTNFCPNCGAKMRGKEE